MSLYYLIENYLMKRKGQQITGIITQTEDMAVAAVFYTIKCKYQDSIYTLKFNLGQSDYKANDSITFFFNPKNATDFLYPVDNQFRKGTYIGLVLGIILLTIAFIIAKR